jgi:hypothetical protein
MQIASQAGFCGYGATITNSSLVNGLCKIQFSYCFNGAGFPFNIYLFASPISYISNTRTVRTASQAYTTKLPRPTNNPIEWKGKCILNMCNNLTPRCINYITDQYANKSYYCINFDYSFPTDAFLTYNNLEYTAFDGSTFNTYKVSQRMYCIVIASTNAIKHPNYKTPIPLISNPFSPYDWLYKNKPSDYKAFAHAHQNNFGDGRIWNTSTIACQAANDNGAGINYILYPNPIS